MLPHRIFDQRTATIASGVDEVRFRAVMSSVCTPVSVVTTAMPGGPPHGTTVSAFTSLSLRPPMVLIALDRLSRTLSVVCDAGRFGINVLGRDQRDLAVTFARDGNRFAGAAWALDDGLPRLGGAAAWLSCRVDDIVDGGDHMIVLARVLDASHHIALEPLTYHRREFGTHARGDDPSIRD